MINKVMLVGRLGKMPELKHYEGGMAYSFLNLALSATRKGEKVTDWVSVKVFGKTAESCAKYLDKGSMVHVEGRLSPFAKQVEDGKILYTLDVIGDSIQFLSSKKEQNEPVRKGFERSEEYEVNDIPF